MQVRTRCTHRRENNFVRRIMSLVCRQGLCYTLFIRKRLGKIQYPLY
jgi:hypothetical protein